MKIMKIKVTYVFVYVVFLFGFYVVVGKLAQYMKKGIIVEIVIGT